MSELQKRLRMCGDGSPYTLGCVKEAIDAQAQEIARLTAELADERQSREINRAVATAALDERDALRARLAGAEAKYADLIFRVGEKHPGETRHETACRYIEQAERATDGAAQASAARGGA